MVSMLVLVLALGIVNRNRIMRVYQASIPPETKPAARIWTPSWTLPILSRYCSRIYMQPQESHITLSGIHEYYRDTFAVLGLWT